LFHIVRPWISSSGGAEVKFINTDGMAFIGPGSEWFWTALTGVVMAVTFIAIYRQLSIARSATAFEQLDAFERELNSERMLMHQLDVLVAIRNGVDPANVPLAGANAIGGFWEKVGNLARRGHIDPRLLWDGSGGDCAAWWVALAPFARRRRQVYGPAFLENFEWLSGVMGGFNRRAGVTTLDMSDEARFKAQLELRLTMTGDLLRVEQRLRSDSVPPDSPEEPSVNDAQTPKPPG
jgi:hypothetical protein